MRRPRRRRILFIVPFAIVAICGGLWWCSAELLRRVAVARLSQLCTGRVEIDRAKFEFNAGLTLFGVRFFGGSRAKSDANCSIEQIHVACTWRELLSRTFQPTTVVIRQPRLRLTGATPQEWQASLPFLNSNVAPSSLRSLRIESAAVQLDDGRSLSGVTIDAGLNAGKSTFSVRGAINDSLWGRWSLDGSVDTKTGQSRLHATSREVKLDERQAVVLGAVARERFATWQPTGTIGVDAIATWDTWSLANFQIRALVDPQQASLRIPSVPERITDLSGRVELTERLVTLQSLVGRIGGGEARISGEVNTETTPSGRIHGEIRTVRIGDVVGTKASRAEADAVVSGEFDVKGGSDPKTWVGSWVGRLEPRGKSTVESVGLRFALANGFANADQIRFQWAGGKLTATAQASLSGEGMLHGSISFRGVQLAEAIAWRPGNADLQGAADGDFDFHVPLSAWSDFRQWQMSGSLSSPSITFATETFRDAEASIATIDQRLVVRSASLDWQGCRLNASGSVVLNAPYELRGTIRAGPASVTELAKRFEIDAAEVSGTASIDGRMTGTLEPLALALAGDGVFRRVRFGTHEIAELPVHFDGNADGFSARFRRAELFGGHVDLELATSRSVAATSSTAPSGSVATAPSLPMHLRLSGRFDDVDISAIAPAGQPRGITGRVSGTLGGTLALATSQANVPSRIHGHVDAQAIQVNKLSLSKASADFVWDRAGFSLPRWVATSEFGPVEGSLDWNLADRREPIRVQVSSERLDLARLTRGQQGSAATGIASLNVALAIDPADGRPHGFGQAHCNRVECDGLTAFGPLDCEVRIDDEQVTLRNLRADAWGGKLAATVEADLAQRLPSNITFSLEGVDLRRLLGDSSGELAPRGTMSGRGTLIAAGTSVRTPKINTSFLELSGGAIAGIPIRQGRADLDVMDEQITLRNISATAADGRVTGDIKLTRQSRRPTRPGQSTRQSTGQPPLVRFDARLGFADVSVPAVLRGAVGARDPTAGKVSGELALQGTNRGWSDTVGEIRVRQLRDADLWRIPLFAGIADWMLPGRARGVFHTGSGVARVRQGIITFDGFSIAGPTAQLYFERGTIYPDRRVELEVIGSAETLIPADLPVIGLFRRATDLLQRSVVKFYVTGTLDQPRVVPVPLAALSEAATKFFGGLLNTPQSRDSTMPR